MGELAELSRRSVLLRMGVIGAGTVAAGGVPVAAIQPQQVVPHADELERFLDGLMAAHLEAHDVAGATVSIVADGELRLAKGYGYADVTTGELVVADETLFRVGSVAKLVTATAVMQSVERGELVFDENVNEYLETVQIPDTYAEPVTLQHLLIHTAGFEGRLRGTFVESVDDLRPLEEMLIEHFPERVRPPGEVTAYSNYGFGLAGHVVAERMGTTFEKYVQENVFDPLGMDRSTFEQPLPGDLADGVANPYTYADGRFQEEAFEYMGVPPAGAMSATATDMARFMLAYLDGGSIDERQVLDPDSAEMMQRRQFSNYEAVNGLGFGFYERDRGDLRIVGHDGFTLQFHSLLALFPEHDIGLFVSYNSTPGGAVAREELFDAFIDEFFEPDIDVPGTLVHPSRGSDLEGSYRVTTITESTYEKLEGAPGILDVQIADDGALMSNLWGEESQRWVEVRPLVFQAADGHDTLAFREGPDGQPTYAFLNSVPMLGFERLKTHETPLVQATALAVSVLLFVSAVIGWSAIGLWRRYQRRLPGDELPRVAGGPRERQAPYSSRFSPY